MKLNKTLAMLVVVGLSACDKGSKVEVTVDPETVLANGMTARQSADARQLNFKDLGGAFKTVNDVLKLPEPDLNAIQLAAKDVKYASDELLYWFAEGSGPETGLEMEAKIDIWQDFETFKQHNQKFGQEAAKLHEVAQAGNFDEIRAQARLVGGQCKACHDLYREEDD